jgi:hypothetical protein
VFEVPLDKKVWYKQNQRVRIIQVALPPVGRYIPDIGDAIVTMTCRLTDAEKVFLRKYPKLAQEQNELTHKQYGGNWYTIQEVANAAKVTNDAKADAENHQYMKRLVKKTESGKTRLLRNIPVKYVAVGEDGEEKRVDNVNEETERIDMHGYTNEGTVFSCQEILDQVNDYLVSAGLRHLSLEFRDNVLRIKDRTQRGHRLFWQAILNTSHSKDIRKHIMPLLGVHEKLGASWDGKDIPLQVYYMSAADATAYRSGSAGTYLGKDLFTGGLRVLNLTCEVVRHDGDAGLSLAKPVACIPLRSEDETRPIVYEPSNPLTQQLPIVQTGDSDHGLEKLRFTLAAADEQTKFALGSGMIHLLMEIYSEKQAPQQLASGFDYPYISGLEVRR